MSEIERVGEMIERVARAIAQISTGSDANWPDFVLEARAAIEAMREPTDVMEGVIFNVDCWDERATEPASNVWRAMIDAALS